MIIPTHKITDHAESGISIRRLTPDIVMPADRPLQREIKRTNKYEKKEQNIGYSLHYGQPAKLQIVLGLLRGLPQTGIWQGQRGSGDSNFAL